MKKVLLEMNQRERDVLKVMSLVFEGKRTQGEAGRLLSLSERQIRRIRRALEAGGDGAVIHGLRGRPSNRRLEESVKRSALDLYRRQYGDFGPTLAAEKLAKRDGVVVKARTLRQWLLESGLIQPKRRRAKHRSRRARRACFGEMIQADASEHDWLEGRGPRLTLVGMIDDATSRVTARFHASETIEAYMDVLGRWIQQYGRPVSWYSDRHSIFRAEDKHGQSTLTQFSRALRELDIELIMANSPQAKGRIERLWGTAQDRLVKELRLAGACTIEQADKVLEEVFLPWFNEYCMEEAASGNDAHRALGKNHDLAAILSIQEQRVIANDYTIRFERKVYQLLPPVWPGERGGKAVVERHLDGSMKIRFKGRYLEYQLAARQAKALGAPPPNPRSLSQELIPAEHEEDRAAEAARPAVHQPADCSGRTPALPCPSGDGSCGTGNNAWRPAPNHPWRKFASG
jgi:hypothetical protein